MGSENSKNDNERESQRQQTKKEVGQRLYTEDEIQRALANQKRLFEDQQSKMQTSSGIYPNLQTQNLNTFSGPSTSTAVHSTAIYYWPAKPSSTGPSYDTPFSARPSHVTPSFAMPTNVTPSSVEPTHVTPVSARILHVAQSSDVPSHATPSFASPSHVTPSSAGPSHVKPFSVGTTNVTPFSKRPSHVTSSSARPSHVTPFSALPSPVKPYFTRSTNVTQSSVGPSHVKLVSAGPLPVAPSSDEPSHVTPSSAGPSSAGTKHVTPFSTRPSHVTPSPARPSHVTPVSARPSHVSLSYTRPTNVTSSSARPSHVTPSSAGPSHVTPSSVGPNKRNQKQNQAQRPRSRSRVNQNTRQLSGIVNCVTCYGQLSLHIYQCTNGHSSCDACRLKMARCGNCTEMITDMRNITLESTLADITINTEGRMKCSNAKDGCCLHFTREQLQEHLKECPFNIISCPVMEFSGDCSWKGTIRQLATHFSDAHPKHREGDVNKEMHIVVIEVDFKVMHLVNIGFHQFLVHIRIDRSLNNIYMVTQYLGTNVSASKWTYEWHVYNKKEPRRKFEYIDSCRSNATPVSEIVQNNNCAVMNLNYAKTFLDNGKLTFKFSVKKQFEGKKNNDTSN